MQEEHPPSTSWNPSQISQHFHKLVEKFRVRPKTRKELMAVLRKATRHHLLDNESLEMIEGVFQVSEMQVRDIMVARTQMVVINPNRPFEESLATILKSAHSRFPVIDEKDKVRGILLAKDLLRFSYAKQKQPPNLFEIIHKVAFVPESKRLDKLLRQFRVTYNHMAIVVDEYNNIAGLVTIEDVLEQIVGKIEDEYYVESGDQNIISLKNDEYLVQALTPIAEFNNYFETQFDEKDFDTIAGLVAQRFGHLPSRGETIEIDHIKFYVLNANKRKIKLLKVIKNRG